jgi:hypothetical protein
LVDSWYGFILSVVHQNLFSRFVICEELPARGSLAFDMRECVMGRLDGVGEKGEFEGLGLHAAGPAVTVRPTGTGAQHHLHVTRICLRVRRCHRDKPREATTCLFSEMIDDTLGSSALESHYFDRKSVPQTRELKRIKVSPLY